jgi:DNA-binding GntR family transcriptional regulator
MVKESLAAKLRDEIIAGRLKPGETIVEGKWAKKLDAAQASVREALNMLIAEGFVQKEPGRSAVVTRLTQADLSHIYDLRGVLEGYAAQLVAQRKPDLSDLAQALADMSAAADCNNMEAFYRRDLHFHLLVCQKSGNPHLEQTVRRLVGPLFAFVVMRLHEQKRDAEHWKRSVAQHQQMLDALRTGNPELAEKQFRSVIRYFHNDTAELISVMGMPVP